MKIIKDYCEIIPTFLNENYDSDENYYSPDINFTSEMNGILSLLMNISKSIDKYSGAGAGNSGKIQADVFAILFDNVFTKHRGNILRTEATKTMKIINSEPYYINNIVV